MKTRLEHPQGFTFIELLVVIVIISILAAFAYPAYASMVRRARYADVKQAMGTMVTEAQMYHVENAQYPPDVNSGVRPEGFGNWPEEPPLNGTFDYDHWGVGGGQCYVQIGFVAEDNNRDYAIHKVNAPPQQFVEFNDDVVLGVKLYACSVAKGSIR
ncbi:MAG: type IV pilin protein [Leptolyngbyaceae cyanobacterium]